MLEDFIAFELLLDFDVPERSVIPPSLEMVVFKDKRLLC